MSFTKFYNLIFTANVFGLVEQHSVASDKTDWQKLILSFLFMSLGFVITSLFLARDKE